jgi:intracellular septation protein
MRLLIDFFPLAVFFVAFKLWDIYVATGVAIAATVLQIVWIRLHHGKVDPMQWVSLAIIVLFGGATILLHDDMFIRIKPTILYWVLGGVLAGGQLFMRRNPMKALMGAQMELPETVWRALGWSWAAFFAAMGALNLWVAFHFDEKTWVNFKVFGILGLMVVFVVVQAVFLGRYVKSDA